MESADVEVISSMFVVPQQYLQWNSVFTNLCCSHWWAKHLIHITVTLSRCIIGDLKSERRLTFRGVQASSAAAMFGVVVDEHVVWDRQHVTVHVDCSGNHHLRAHTHTHTHTQTQRNTHTRVTYSCKWLSIRCIRCSRCVSYLEPPHVSWVSCIFQTVLIALEEELEEESADKNKNTHTHTEQVSLRRNNWSRISAGEWSWAQLGLILHQAEFHQHRF